MVAFAALSQFALLAPALLFSGAHAAPRASSHISSASHISHSSTATRHVVTATKEVNVHMPAQSGASTVTTTISTVVPAKAPSTTLTGAKAAKTPAISSAPNTTKTISGCHVEGVATPGMRQRLRHATSEQSFKACQTFCFLDTPCESYSYDPTTRTCSTYYEFIDITPSNTTGIYFSNKYPSDGSNFCYGVTGY